VIKAQWKKNMQPRVISPSSACAQVAAAIGTVRDEEVGDFLDPEQMDRNFWRWLHPRHMLRRGVVADQNRLREALSKLLRDMTFSEAYEHSQRIINITVSPKHTNQLPRLLNYLTFPHLYILEAVLASCAIPFVFPPVMLMTREPDGARVPFQPTQKWVDGSMKSDLPILRLRRLHNVNHTIVSQTNPIVLPFMQFRGVEQRHATLGSSSRDFLLTAARYQTRGALDLVRRNVGFFGAARRSLDDAYALMEQDYRGNITILPRFKLINYLRLAANPTAREIDDYVLEGERSTWPRLALIRNSTVIGQTLDGCLDRLNAKGTVVEAQAQVQARKRPSLRLVR
jgi:NTE family protein